MMRRWICVWIGTVILGSFPTSSHAYRPFATEDAGVSAPGEVQVEASWDTIRWRSSDSEHVFLLVPIAGIGWRSELSLEVPYMIHEPAEGPSRAGFGDVSLVAKRALLDERARLPALTLKGAVKTDSGDSDRGLGSGDFDYTLAAAASKVLGRWALHGMAGYTWVGDQEDDSLTDFTVYGIGLDYALTQTLHLALEISGSRHSDRRVRTDPIDSLFGFHYAFSERVVWDAGIRLGWNDSAPRWNAMSGLTITIL